MILWNTNMPADISKWSTKYQKISRQLKCLWPLGSNNFHNTLTSQWAQWHLTSPASRLFAQPFVHAQIRENIKDPRHRPLGGKSTGDRWFPFTKASNAENVSIWGLNHEKYANGSRFVVFGTGWYHLNSSQCHRWHLPKFMICCAIETAMKIWVNSPHILRTDYRSTAK